MDPDYIMHDVMRKATKCAEHGEPYIAQGFAELQEGIRAVNKGLLTCVFGIGFEVTERTSQYLSHYDATGEKLTW